MSLLRKAGSLLVRLYITGMRPLVIVAQRLMVGMDIFVLLAVPLFTLSGYLMEQGGLSRRLVDWVGKLFGGIRGSAGIITIICCAIFLGVCRRLNELQ